MRRVRGLLRPVAITAFIATFVSLSSVASASAIQVSGSLYYSKITCQFTSEPTDCAGSKPSTFVPFADILAFIVQSPGSSTVIVHAEGPDGPLPASSSLAGNVLEWSFSGSTPEEHGVRALRQESYKITFSADRLSWSGTRDVTFSKEEGGVVTQTAEERNSIEGARSPVPLEALVQCVVPRVKGRTLASAEKTIVKAHCGVGKVKKVSSKRVKKGHVTAQSASPGRALSDGAKINLVVSKG
jgi:PASTA domain